VYLYDDAEDVWVVRYYVVVRLELVVHSLWWVGGVSVGVRVGVGVGVIVGVMVSAIVSVVVVVSVIVVVSVSVIFMVSVVRIRVGWYLPCPARPPQRQPQRPRCLLVRPHWRPLGRCRGF
jgi:hypothetical protein